MLKDTINANIFDVESPLYDCFYIKRYKDGGYQMTATNVLDDGILIKRIYNSTYSNACKEYERILNLRTYLICG